MGPVETSGTTTEPFLGVGPVETNGPTDPFLGVDPVETNGELESGYVVDPAVVELDQPTEVA